MRSSSDVAGGGGGVPLAGSVRTDWDAMGAGYNPDEATRRGYAATAMRVTVCWGRLCGPAHWQCMYSPRHPRQRDTPDCVRCSLPYAGVPSGDTHRWQALVDLARGSEQAEAVCQAGLVVSSSVVPQSHHEYTW